VQLLRCIFRGRVHVNRISAANTLKKMNVKSYFHGSVALYTVQHRKIDQIMYRWPPAGHPTTCLVSQLVVAYSGRLFARAQLEETRHVSQPWDVNALACWRFT
jgi:hypothetical protein